MSIMNTFTNGGGGVKDLTPFVYISSGGEVYYAQYSITRYPGKGSNYTHLFSGYVHFSTPNYGATVTITIPESYKINGTNNLTVAVKGDNAVSYSTQRFEILGNRAAIRFTSQAFQGFIFPTFLCTK